MSERMFVAIVPPEEALEHLDEFVEPRRQRDDPVHWTRPERWHVTLAFLPAVSEDRYYDLADGLAAAAERRQDFALAISGAGSFPNPAQAKVLWAGMAGGVAALAQLASGARTAAGTAGVRVDGATFAPHLTLGRLSPPRDVTKWLRVLDLYAGPAWPVTEIALIESRADSSHYTRDTFALGSIPVADQRWWARTPADPDVSDG